MAFTTKARVLGMMLALASVGSVAGCRSCAEDRGSAPAVDAGPAQPTMPQGMLVPAAERADGGETDAGGTMRIARGVKGGAWTELQVARPGDTAQRTDFQHWRDDSWFVSLEAMTQMHEAFARALPGFDLFLPRLFGPDALAKLAGELDAFAASHSSSGDLAATARDLAQLARTTAGRGQSLWVLGA